MLVKNRKVLPSLPRCPGELIAFFHLLPSQRHTHTHARPPYRSTLLLCYGREGWRNHFSPLSSFIATAEFTGATSEQAKPSWWTKCGSDRGEAATLAPTPAVVWMHVSRQAEWLDDWAMRKQVTQKSSFLAASSPFLPPQPRLASPLAELPTDVHFGWLRCDLLHPMWHQRMPLLVAFGGKTWKSCL